MSTKFQIDDSVLVPAARLRRPERYPHALVPKRVLARSERSITVDDEYDVVTIASRLVHPQSLGFLILRIGDLATEINLLDPLAKSILQFLRLLLPDNDLRYLSIRTVAELDYHWDTYHHATSHVVIVGHGAPDHISFVDAGAVSGQQLAEHLSRPKRAITPKVFISLACQTGRAGFAKPFSRTMICRDLIAPFNSVHGAGASQFCQSLLASHLLAGTELAAAYSQAKKGVVGGTAFRRWRDGLMK